MQNNFIAKSILGFLTLTIFFQPQFSWAKQVTQQKLNVDKVKLSETFNVMNIFASPTPEVVLSLNGLDVLTQEVLPILAEDAGLDDMDYDEDLDSGTLQVYDVTANWFKGEWKDCVDYDISLESNISLPVDSNDVTAEFTSAEQVKTHWNINDARISGDIVVDLENGDDSGNLFCAGWNLLNLLTSDFLGTSRIAFDLEDFSGDFDVTLKTSKVSIDSIDDITLKFDDVTLENTQIWDALAKVGLWIVDIFRKKETCDNLEECVSNLLTKEIQSGSVKSEIKGAINDMLAKTAELGGGTVDGIDYAVAIEEVDGKSSNRLETEWSVALSSDENDDCAAGLEEGYFRNIAAEDLGSDIDIAIPFGLIGKAAYETGKQGLFCRSFTRNVSDDAEAADIDTPVGVAESLGGISSNYSGTIVPFGEIEVESVAEVSLRNGKMLSLNVTHSNSGDVKITVPLKLNDLTLTTSAFGDSEVFEADDLDISASLIVEVSIDLNCDDGLFLKVESVNLDDLEGSVSFAGETLDASEFQDDLEGMADEIAEDLDILSLLPKVTDLEDIGLFVEINQVEVDEDVSGIYLGLGLVNADTCDDAGGGGGGGSPGPGYIPPGDFHLFDPFDRDDNNEDGGHEVDDGLGDGIAETMGSGM